MNNNSQWENLIAEDLNPQEQANIAGGAGIADFLLLQNLFGSNGGTGGGTGGLDLNTLFLIQALQDPNAAGGGILSGLFGPATPAD
ncbi:hypothetical protein [Mastigocoleus sp. MO_188.B34]|uniref:hypothetical protein n=1 Tax=Mastigocoleus sp. MO_188.B34 TaxID=3036635 RepID=UPI002609CDF0|nr:hypothetical protein [Mastigocoleus sp. MO_188.B34]MDJ0694263.1 hypothetical protein [Mastigocoleus sp. MO_188.B34]